MFLRRLLTYIFILFACLASYGQVNQVLWGKGKALYANPIATIDSLTYGQLLYGDTLYIIFDRESKRIVYDTIHIHMPGVVFHDTIYTTDTIYLESGRRIGLFSVGPNQYVTFSQGNLQYTQSTDTWQFANEQWECIGAGNIKEGALADKIDLFGWSANNTTAPWGVSLSRNNADYAGEFVDWGENIINSDVPNTWRTLTNAEWEYVLNSRDNASQLRCRAQVDHVNGFVFLPDEWVCPDGIELNLEQQTTKVFTRDEWSKMENAGAVFLPSAGRIDNKKLVNFDDHGNYWSSTRINDQWVDYLAFTFSSNKLYVDHQMPIYLGRSVRLVRDTIVPKPEYVDLGLSVKWATFNVGATSPEDYGDYFVAGDKYDYLIGQTEVTRALWKAVMGNLPNNSATTTDAPIDNVTWGECQEFINQLNSLTGMHFRFPTKEEWLYAAKGGPYNKDFLYSGSDNIDEVGWYDGNTPGGVQPVAQLKPNALGIYDMTGNVWEWVLQTSNNAHLYVGGSYAFNATSCLLGNKGTATSPDHKGSIGLRLVLDTHQYVDLGLSVKWATFNVGATSPEEYGDYFAWGETEPKETYSWATYKWCDGTDANITKYNTIDGKTILEPTDDAAQVHRGDKWRMPTKAECQELIDSCTWEWTTSNNISGYRVTGPNGNSIFLPAARSLLICATTTS